MSLLGIDAPLDVVVQGLTTGIAYGLLALGLTLTFTSTRVINFAHGQLGALAAALLPLLVLQHHVPYTVALLLALAVAMLCGLLRERRVLEPLQASPRLLVMVATIAVAQLLFVAESLLPSGDFLRSGGYRTPFQGHVTVA